MLKKAITSTTQKENPLQWIITHHLDIWEPVFFFATSGFGIQQNWIQKKADDILFLSSHLSVFLSHLSAAVHPHPHILCALLENVKIKTFWNAIKFSMFLAPLLPYFHRHQPPPKQQFTILRENCWAVLTESGTKRWNRKVSVYFIYLVER